MLNFINNIFNLHRRGNKIVDISVFNCLRTLVTLDYLTIILRYLFFKLQNTRFYKTKFSNYTEGVIKLLISVF